MDIQEVREKIEEHIARGHADKAIAELLKYTKATKSPLHEDVLILSGQLRQWKRENMLGVQQSNNEVSRIKMGVLSMMKSLEQLPSVETPPPATASSVVQQASVTPIAPPVVQQTPVTKTTPTAQSSNNAAKILGGIGGVILLLAVAWFAMGRGGESPVDPVTNNEQKSDSLALAAENKSAVVQTDNEEKSETPPAQTTEQPASTARRAAATNKEPTSNTTKTRTPVTSREITLPKIVATVNCNGRTYKLGSDNRVYDTTSSARKIGTSTEGIKCVDGILVAKIVQQYGGYLTYYNQSKNDWMETLAEAKQ